MADERPEVATKVCRHAGDVMPVVVGVGDATFDWNTVVCRECQLAIPARGLPWPAYVPSEGGWYAPRELAELSPEERDAAMVRDVP